MELKFGKYSETFGRIAEIAMSPNEYYKLIRNFNNFLQAELATLLRKKASRIGSAVTLMATGSDGRREKGSIASTLEIIAVVNEDVPLDALKDVLTNVVKSVFPKRIATVSEIKGPHSELSFYNDNALIVQPGRIADSRLIYGQQSAVTEVKKKLGRQIIALPRNKIVERVAGLRGDAKKVVETGKNRIGGHDAVHFDLENGLVFYNPKKNQLSFKIGPLRLVQNTLLVEEIKHSRREGDPDFLSRLASGIVPRVKELADDRLLSLTRESVDELAEHYAYFLRMYHRSEQAFSQRGELVVQLDKSDVDEIAKRLVALRCIIDNLKIGKQLQ